MNPEAARERDAILAELDAVVRELEAAAGEASRQRGIGAERLVWVLSDLANKYRGVRNRVRALN